MRKTYFETMSGATRNGSDIPVADENLTPSQKTLRDYYLKYDALDSQGQFNPLKIHAQLASEFFGPGVSADEGLADLRRRAAAEVAEEAAKDSSVGKSPGSTKTLAAVADSAVRILEGGQAELFAAPAASEKPDRPVPERRASAVPTESLNRVLEPKSEMELNYEDFEAVFGLLKSRGEKPDYVEFETSVNGRPRLCRVPWLSATSLTKPSSKTIRILALYRFIHPDLPPE